MKSKKYILVYNSGSSSLKYKLFEKKSRTLLQVHEGHIDNHGKALLNIHSLVAESLASLLKSKITSLKEIVAIGHRVVHGGEMFKEPTITTKTALSKLKKLNDLAPLHNPVNCSVIEACMSLVPHAKQVAIFDTAFHQTIPEHAYLYAVPYEWYTKLGIHRYGFHGTSHEYVYSLARKKLGTAKTRRAVTCHLGNGCSITAIKNGKVIDTSMGFTPLEGVPMGTRSGSIDPSIIFYLAKHGVSLEHIEKTLLYDSGLKGLSQLSSDVRDLHSATKKEGTYVRASRALDVYCYAITKYIGAYATILGGLDAVIFTGGTGENAEYLREQITRELAVFKPFKTLVIHTDEERAIAEKTVKLIT